MDRGRVVRVAMFLTATAVVAGCGGDGSSSVDSTAAPVGDDNAGSGDAGSGDVVAEDGASTSAGSDIAPGSGFIQIGDLRQDLTVELCANVLGGINGRAVAVSDPDNVKVVFNISPEDWAGSGTFDEPGSIQYSESLATSWTTGQHRYIDDYQLPADVDTSSIAITSYDIADDDQWVTGEATFYDLNALVYATPVAPETGSFAFACPSG